MPPKPHSEPYCACPECVAWLGANADPATTGAYERLPRNKLLIVPPQPDEIDDGVALKYALLRERLLSADDIEKMPPPEPLVDGLLYLNTLTTTFGRPGTGKSFVAMTMSFAVATGEAWFGHKTKHGPVLYIAAEGAAGLAQRQRAWRAACGYPNLDNMHWLPLPVNLLDAEWTRALVRLVKDLRPVLVVVDTLARTMPGGDENASKDMSRLVGAADQLRLASGACVNLVHHTPRDGNTPRGHSSLEGATDSQLYLERAGRCRFTLTNTKQKDAAEAERLTFALVPVGESAVLELVAATPASDPRTELEGAVVAALTGLTEPISLRAIRSAIPKRPTEVAEAVSRLVASGAIERVPGTRGAVLHKLSGSKSSGSRSAPIGGGTTGTTHRPVPETTGNRSEPLEPVDDDWDAADDPVF